MSRHYVSHFFKFFQLQNKDSPLLSAKNSSSNYAYSPLIVAHPVVGTHKLLPQKESILWPHTRFHRSGSFNHKDLPDVSENVLDI